MDSVHDQLTAAIEKNDISKVRSLMPMITIECVGTTPLHHAVQLGRPSIVKSLLEAGWGKCLDRFDDVSFTPLMWAVRNNHLEVVKALVEAGADINARDEVNVGNTALREAAEAGSPEMIQFLLDAGGDPTIRGWMQLNAIDKAEERVEQAGSSTSRLVLRLLSEHSRRKEEK